MSSKSFPCQSDVRDYIRIKDEDKCDIVNFMIQEEGRRNYVNLHLDQVREMISCLQFFVGEGVPEHQSQPALPRTPLDGFRDQCAVAGTGYGISRIHQTNAYVLRINEDESAVILNVVQMRELRDAIQRMIGHLDGFFESEASHG